MSKPFRARKTILNACTRKTGEQDYLLKRIRIAVKLSTVRIHEMLLKILEKLQKYITGFLVVPCQDLDKMTKISDEHY